MIRLILMLFLQNVVNGNTLHTHNANKSFESATPPLGKAILQEFLIDPNLVFLNHGSDGTYPKVVKHVLHAYQRRVERNPDLWHRRDVIPDLAKVRQLLAKLMNADAGDVVMIPNVTSGMNAILRSLIFRNGERILHFSTIYRDMERLIQYIVDINNGAVSKLVFNVTYPMSNDELVQKLENFLVTHDDPKKPIRLALVDHITSTPAVVNPIEKIIPMLKRRNITVLIDGAHAVGQVKIDLKALKPDYYVSSCNKWLFASRGSAVLYVDKKQQPFVHPAHINAAYTNPGSFQNEFFWTGTMDFCNYMTIPAAIEFRETLGGEQVVMNYNHNLAVEGGNYLAGRLGTEVMQQHNQIGSMIDVRLPVYNPNDPIFDASEWWVNAQLSRYPETFAPVYKHNGQWWARLSAQIYNDINDFEVAAKHFTAICDQLNQVNNGTIV